MTITTASTAASFAGHEPGQPYGLTQQQFCRFAGLPDFTGPTFWAALAAREAERCFNPLAELCHSELTMDTETGAMRWWYRTTSGTELEAIEHRTLLTQSAPGYPGVECSQELPAATYTVVIPAERDHPGRYHWQQLRDGGSYCS